jgi:hypothetical protein
MRDALTSLTSSAQNSISPVSCKSKAFENNDLMSGVFGSGGSRLLIVSGVAFNSYEQFKRVAIPSFTVGLKNS